jgi:hypothetical protein
MLIASGHHEPCARAGGSVSGCCAGAVGRVGGYKKCVSSLVVICRGGAAVVWKDGGMSNLKVMESDHNKAHNCAGGSNVFPELCENRGVGWSILERCFVARDHPSWWEPSI